MARQTSRGAAQAPRSTGASTPQKGGARGRSTPAKPLRPVDAKASTTRPKASRAAREASARGPLLAMVQGLLALLAAQNVGHLDPLARALYLALEAIAGRVEELLRAPQGSAQLVAHTSGPVVGLRVAPVPAASAGPLPAERDPALAALGNDLATVLEHHEPLAPPSSAAETLCGVMVSALLLVRRHLEHPGTTLEAFLRVNTGGVDSTELRLLEAQTAAPPPAIGPRHQALAACTLEALEHLAHAQGARSLAASSLSKARQGGEMQSANLEAAREALEELDGALGYLSDGLGGIAGQLTGEESEGTTPVRHAIALQELLIALRAPELRQSWEARAIRTAAAAFATPAT